MARKFSKATNDIENAGDCIALGVPTPAVFCLMRVMERGVQRLGKRLGVQLTGETVWQKILDQVNKQITLLPATTPGEKKRKAQFQARFGQSIQHLVRMEKSGYAPKGKLLSQNKHLKSMDSLRRSLGISYPSPNGFLTLPNTTTAAMRRIYRHLPPRPRLS